MTSSKWIAFFSCSLLQAIGSAQIKPTFPLQFSTQVQIISHQRDANATYPPPQQLFSIQYDFLSKRSNVVMNKGYNEGKTYIRRYDSKNEYMVKSGEYSDCQRAYLGEEMPTPAFPNDFEYIGEDVIEDNVIVKHWRQVTETTQIELYMSSTEPSRPIQLTEYSLWSVAVNDGGNATPLPLRTTRWFNTVLGPPEFVDTLPGGYTHEECTRNVAGFPYIRKYTSLLFSK